MTGEEIRAMRKALGYSASEFASLLGVKQQTVWKWEGGFVQAGKTAILLMARLEPKVHLAVELVEPGKESV